MTTIAAVYMLVNHSTILEFTNESIRAKDVSSRK